MCSNHNDVRGIKPEPKGPLTNPIVAFLSMAARHIHTLHSREARKPAEK